MRTSSALLCIVVAACGGKKDEPKKQAPAKTYVKHRVDAVRMKVPEGWTSQYDALIDGWRFTNGTATVTFDRAPPQTVASPDALLYFLRTKRWSDGARGRILKREALSDGYATLIESPTSTEGYVVKELGSEWFLCASSGTDDATREQALALCKSIKR